MDSKTASSALSKFDELYGAATVGESAPLNSDIPDGEYAAVVEEVTLIPSSTSAPAIAWTFRIRGGMQSDRLLHKVRPITERTIAWVKEDLIKCGLELNVFSDLSNRIGELRSAPVTVLKRGDNDFGVHLQWPKKAQSQSG
jgi:hypothetical protein